MNFPWTLGSHVFKYDNNRLNLGWNDGRAGSFCYSVGHLCGVVSGVLLLLPQTFSIQSERSVMSMNDVTCCKSASDTQACQNRTIQRMSSERLERVFIVPSIQLIRASCPFGHSIRKDFLGHWDTYSLEIECPTSTRERDRECVSWYRSKVLSQKENRKSSNSEVSITLNQCPSVIFTFLFMAV